METHIVPIASMVIDNNIMTRTALKATGALLGWRRARIFLYQRLFNQGNHFWFQTWLILRFRDCNCPDFDCQQCQEVKISGFRSKRTNQANGELMEKGQQWPVIWLVLTLKMIMYTLSVVKHEGPQEEKNYVFSFQCWYSSFVFVKRRGTKDVAPVV